MPLGVGIQENKSSLRPTSFGILPYAFTIVSSCFDIQFPYFGRTDRNRTGTHYAADFKSAVATYYTTRALVFQLYENTQGWLIEITVSDLPYRDVHGLVY